MKLYVWPSWRGRDGYSVMAESEADAILAVETYRKDHPKAWMPPFLDRKVEIYEVGQVAVDSLNGL
jgi:hypothetical protein